MAADKDALLRESVNYASHRYGCRAIVNPDTDDCECGFRKHQRRVTEHLRAADVPSTYELLDYPDRITATLAEKDDGGWMPIETAPKDNKRPLYLSRIADGELKELDFDGIWRSESESWEMPEVYYFWDSAHGIEEPTHWAYQDRPLPPLPKGDE